MKRSAIVVAGVVLLLFVWERKRPLRPSVEATPRRWKRNAAIAALGGVAVAAFEAPVVKPLCRWAELHRVGLLGRLRPGSVLRQMLSLVLLDYTLFGWHVLTHRIPLLWRFHAVHHMDRDMDFTTGARFHFGELMLSVPWRAAQIVVLGIDSRAFACWNVFLQVCVLFHHANVTLPASVEAALGYVLVTPAMHGAHHSITPQRRNTNWSSGLSLWDRLHGTLHCPAQPQAEVVGLPAPDDSVSGLLRAPFTG